MPRASGRVPTEAEIESVHTAFRILRHVQDAAFFGCVVLLGQAYRLRRRRERALKAQEDAEAQRLIEEAIGAESA
jgi:hypothetical protein